MLIKLFLVRDSLLLQNFLQKLGYIERKMVISDKSEVLNKYIDLSTLETFGQNMLIKGNST